MSLDQIISITVERRTTQPTQAGFGTPLIAAHFPISVFSDRTRSYSSLTALTDDFETTDPVYLQAEAILSQSPSPSSFKVGRRALAPQQVLNVSPDAPVAGEVHTVTVTGYKDVAFASRGTAGNYVSDTYALTIAAESDEEDIVDAFVLEFGTTNPNEGDWTATKSGTGAAALLVITADNSTMDGLIFGVTYDVDSKTRGVNDVTPDPGIATDLAAIQTYDPDWFGLCIDSNSQAEIESAASWVQANGKLFVCQTQDVDVAGTSVASDTTSVAAVLKSNSYTSTMLFYHRNNLDMVSGAMLGKALPYTPGSINWAYQQLAGVQAQDLTDNELTNLQASVGSPTGGKDVNTVTSLNGISITRYGTSMQGEFMDVYRYALYLEARLQEDVYAALVNNSKLPMSDPGIQSIRGIVLARLEEGVTIGALLGSPEPTCTVPRASEISASDRANRLLSGVTFRAQLAQAVNFVAIEGELNA